MYEKDLPEFWLNLKPESIVTIADTQAIKDSMDAGEGTKGIDYVVKYILKIKHLQGLAEWLLLNLEGTDQDLWLMVKIVDKEMSLRVYYEPPEFESGNREDMIEKEEFWLFKEPEDPDNFEFNDLSYADKIEQTIKTSEGEQELIYNQKAQGVIYGACTCRPLKSGMEESFATLVEYTADQECENPELLIFELGPEDSKEGGHIRMMLGAELNFSDIDVLQT